MVGTSKVNELTMKHLSNGFATGNHAKH